jgi:competence protein ComEA
MKFRRFAPVLLVASLLVPALAGAAGSESAPPAAHKGGQVNLNTATAEQIALLPRVGIKVAQRVIDYRKTNGAFKRVEDLMQVKGIGEKQFLTLKSYLAVSGPTTLTEKVKSTGSRGRARNARTAKKA